MTDFSDEDLLSYADEFLDVKIATCIEEALRSDANLRKRLQELIESRDSGALTIGEVWRLERLSCPTRSEWGLYLIGAIESQRRDYMQFHLETIGCIYCLATVEELRIETENLEQTSDQLQRREKLFASSAGLLGRGDSK